jgi:FliG C-terminal domain
LFEDLEKLEPSALKAVLREVDLQTLVMSLRGVSESFRLKVLENMTAGKAEIVKEELDLSDGTAGKPTLDAQRKISLIARRLQKEGHINIPQVDNGLPSSRFGNSLKSALKLPSDIHVEEDTLPPEKAEIMESPADIEDRIRKFMNRRPTNKERYPGIDGGGV